MGSATLWSVWTSWLVEYPIENALNALYSAGFKSLELSVEHFNECLARSGELACLDETESFKARALSMSKRGAVRIEDFPPVRFVHAHGPFRPFCIRALDEVDKAVAVVSEWIRWCTRLGVDTLVCHPFTAEGVSEEKLERVNLIGFKSLSRVAEECGVTLAVENMARGFGSCAAHILRLIREYPALAACIDTGHANICAYRGKVHELVMELGGHIAATHVSDNDGSSDQHLFPGKGVIDWPSVLDALRGAGYRKPLNLEIPGELKLCPDPSARVEYLLGLIRGFCALGQRER